MVEQIAIITISVLIGWIIGYMIGQWRCKTYYRAMFQSLLDLSGKDNSEIHVVIQKGKSYGPQTVRTEDKN